MTPQERDMWWQRTIAAIEKRDTRVHTAFLVALILRHGRLENCPAGHTHVVERLTIEEVMHTIKDYGIAFRVAEFGVIEVQAIAKGDITSGEHPNAQYPS